jgi:hypothetical protein
MQIRRLCLQSATYLAGFVALISISVCAQAQVVVPTGFDSTEGTSAEGTSLGDFSNRVQTIYGTTLLTGLHVGDVITGLSFRVDGIGPAPGPQTVANYEIRLSKSPKTPGTLSNTLADNRGADEVIVRSGPLTIAAGDYPTGSSPNAFGAIIGFTTPYTYTGGPLLLEYSHTPFPSTHSFADAAGNIADGQSAFGTGFNATTADIGMTNNVIVVRFQTVPEPSTLLMSILPLLALCRRRARASVQSV